MNFLKLKQYSMVEVIKHALGLCGEHFHPNLWTLLLGGVGLSTIFSYVRLYIKCKFNQALAYTSKYLAKINKLNYGKTRSSFVKWWNG